MLVRDARAGELDTVGELTVLAYRGLVSDRYAQVLRDAPTRAREARLLVCEHEQRIAGTATFVADGGPWREIAGPGEAEFRMLAVDPQARGAGVGAALVEHMLTLSSALGRRRLVCSSARDMEAAHRLYERLGFSRAPGRDWSPVADVTLMVFAHELGAGPENPRRRDERSTGAVPD